MLVSLHHPESSGGSLPGEGAARTLLRYVDRAALDQLTAAFIDAVGLPAAVLSPGGDFVAGKQFRCPACATTNGDAPTPRVEGATVSGWVRCRHGLASVRFPISTRTGDQIATVTVGAVALSDADLGSLRRALVARQEADKGGPVRMSGVPRSAADRAEAAARLLAQALDTVVREAEIASENADLVATQRQANRELTVLYSVSRALSSGIELQGILQRLVDSVGDLLGTDVVLVGLIEGDDLVTVASRGLLSFEARHGRLRVGEGLAGRVAATGHPLTCRDMQDDPRQYLTAINSREDLHAFAGVPLGLQGSTVGVLAVYRRVAHDFPESELQLLAHIADQAAVAMERARLYEQERHTVGELRALHARMEAQHRSLERASAVHTQLTDLVLQDAGLEAIVDALGCALDAPVAVEDQFLHLLAVGPGDTSQGGVEANQSKLASTPRAALVDGEIGRLYDAIRESRRPMAIHAAPALGLDHPRIVAPVIVGGDVLGYLSVVERHRALEEPDFLAVGHAATVVALEMMKQRTWVEVERRLRGELLEELVAGELTDVEATQRRAAYLGYNLGTPHALLLFVVADPTSQKPDGASRARNDRALLTEAIETHVSKHGGGFMVLSHRDGVYVAAPLNEENLVKARELAESLRREAARTITGSLSVGMGRLCLSPEDFAVAASEARRAAALGRALDVSHRVIVFEDLGVYRLLIDLPRPSDAVRFAEQTIGPLEAYDHDHGTCLVSTLEAYLAANGVLQHTAAALSIHVNTLAYRLQRIREVTGADLNDSDARLGLHLASKIRQVVRATTG